VKTSKDFEEFLKLLNVHNVRYVIVGAYAFAIHAYPRSTGDIDIFIATNEDNAQAVLNVLLQFGFESLHITKTDLMKPDMIIQLGYPPYRIDIITSIEGVSFEEVWKDKVVARYGNVDAYFIGRECLIKNKMKVGRPQDLVDVKELKKYSSQKRK